MAVQLTNGIHLNRSSQPGIFLTVNKVEPSYPLAERLLQARLALSPPDAFLHAFYIQTPRCIENVFIRVVPCSDDQDVFFTKGSQACKHNHCCFVRAVFHGGLWNWRLRVRDDDQITNKHSEAIPGFCFCVHLHYSNRIWALHQLSQPVPCVEKTLLLVIQASAILSIYKQRICKNYTVYLAFDFYCVRGSLMMYTSGKLWYVLFFNSSFFK